MFIHNNFLWRIVSSGLEPRSNCWRCVLNTEMDILHCEKHQHRKTSVKVLMMIEINSCLSLASIGGFKRIALGHGSIQRLVVRANTLKPS